ncbi:protein kinase domain-containing protein [Sorangium sp. So ce1153]|uniref:protein kinase domain-containing protein n=1 Tax=Sorangium sp. So ce1153 TaxID=3133333 RepID=UPI003F6384CC
MLLAGQHIDRYLIVERIGAGGMAQVYRAKDQVLGRDVALKLIRPEIAQGAEGRQRFLREAQAIARLEHPGIVRIYDVGVADGVGPFFVMELLRGGSLAELVRGNQKLPPGDVVRIVAEAAEAIQAAHDAGIIHGDVKPGNIGFAVSGAAVGVKVLDFGIARLMGAGEREDAPEIVLGTPGYMAPELLLGQGASTTTDIYGLGLVAREALTGAQPIGAADLRSLLALSKDSDEPSLALDSSVPEPLRALVQDMIARNPARRPSSMEEVARRAREIGSLLGQPAELPVSRQSSASFSLKGLLGLANEAGVEAAVPGLEALETLAPKQVSPPPHGARREAPSAPPRAAVAVERAPVVEPVPLPSPADLVRAALPAELRPHHEAITRFLLATFQNIEPADARGVLRLSSPSRGQVGDYHFFALFMAGVSRGAEDKLGTRTFLNYAIPLEGRLASFAREERKVVVTIVDSPELGAGVRRKIFEYRKAYSAHVVPLHVVEVRKADREGRAAELFDDRLSEYHTREDVFASRDAVRDPTRFYGMKRELAELSAALDRDVAFVAVTGPPGSGKTSLVNMAEYGLEGLRAIRLRASEAAERRALAFAEEILRHLDPGGEATRAEGALGERIQRAAENAHEAARKEGRRALLVLEDSDWLLSPLVDPGAAAEAQREARELVSALGREARRGTLGVVFTGFYGFILEKRSMLGWDNPAAAIAKILRIERLDLPAIARMLRDLGAEINVELDADALAEVHALSGGNIDLARRLTSGALEREARRGGRPRPLEAITVRREAVREAARALEVLPGTFERTVMALLSAVDRSVLQYIAAKRPRSVRHVKTALAGMLSPGACAEAVDRLHEMGFVEVKDGRVRIAIPLLEAWVKQHLENTPGEVRKSRQRRAQILAIGASLTALAFGAYWTWFRSRSVLSAPQALEGCTYQVRAPERGTATDTLSIYVFRHCEVGADPGPIDLFVDMGTVAKIYGQDGGKSDLMRCKPGTDCRMVEVPVTLVSPGEDDYRLRAEVMSKASQARLVVDLRIKDDPLAAIKRTFDGAIKVATAVPALVSVLVAFHRDVLEALRRLLGSSRAEETSGTTTGPGGGA